MISNRELKWEKDRLDDLEYEEQLRLDNIEYEKQEIDKLYYNIYYEFVYAYNYYYSKLDDLLYKNYDCRIDYKLLHIINLPNDIVDRILYYVYINCKDKIIEQKY